MRIGHGFDVHRFEADKPLMLCGIHVPHPYGLQAHSDGDVAIHALCDALLGTVALGDIGQHFPDSEIKNKNRNSAEFLGEIYEMIRAAGFVLENMDLTIIAEQPKLAPHIKKMRKSLATILETKITKISIKATTTEGLGFTGKDQGMAAQAVVLVRSEAN